MKAKNITFNSILIGLTILFLYLSALVPTNTITFLTLSSLIIPISIISLSLYDAILIYIASSFLGFIIIPFNIMLIYTLFIGIYGFFKNYIEKLKNIVLEIVFKLLYFNIILIILYINFKAFIVEINIKFPLILILLGCEIIFLLYDYAISILITFYIKKIYPHVSKR